MNNSTDLLIDIRNVTKTFATSSGEFRALNNVTLGVRAGQLVALTGNSGSGKSTLLNLITGIDKPTDGSVRIAGTPIEHLSEDALASWRGRTIGIVFQFFQLLPTLTVSENVMLPMDFCNSVPKKERHARSLALLDQVGIGDQADKYPSTLSGGQQQRAAIARALANDPSIIVADEPTGNLDSKNAESVFQLFAQLVTLGKTVLIVTHEKEFTRFFQDTVTISDGTIVGASGVAVTK
jgi:putative ABC transport system ATP-binding protein